MNPPTPEPTLVHIELPLPLDIAGTIISAIGQLYPHTVIDQTTSRQKMTLVITEEDRNREDIHCDIEPMRAINADDEAPMIGWDVNGPVLGTPEHLSLELGRIGSALLTATEAENYVEVQVRTPEGERLLITAVKTEAQDPRRLHLAAQATVDRLADALLEIQCRISEGENVHSIAEAVSTVSDTLSTIKARRQTPVDTTGQEPDPLDEVA